MNNKVAVISDIHSNADALKKALEVLKKKKIDITIFLGDILTYGCQPLEVINMLDEYKQENHTIFIKGNHDQFYFDIQSGINKPNYKLPKFITESINWTLEKISPLKLQDFFTWHNSFRIGKIYFAHANFFKYGDWTYIEKSEDIYKSFKQLLRKKVDVGVFGHSHRHMFITNKKNSIQKLDQFPDNINHKDKLIINAGSIGQPRGKGLGFVYLDIKNNNLHNAKFEKIRIDFKNSINLIKQTKFSKETKNKLISYLES